ncbi:MAG: hypothetical protein R3B48_12825 [Kofleriaceae bacterium]
MRGSGRRGAPRALGAAIVAALALALALGSAARAEPFDELIDVETEQDLRDALASEQLTPETFDRLLELLARGVDLETCTREELYELPNLTSSEVDAILALRGRGRPLRDADALVAAGVLDARKAAAIAPFLAGPAARRHASRGSARVTTIVSTAERAIPPLGLRARARGLGGASIGGALAVTRQRVGEVVYDPNRAALLAEEARPRLALAKLFARWEGERFAVLVGTYRAAFGLGLVFADSGAPPPGGIAPDDQLIEPAELGRACRLTAGEAPSPCSSSQREGRSAPDFSWRDSLTGVATRATAAVRGGGELDVAAWASYATRAAYQYELVDQRDCVEASDSGTPACAAPIIYQRPSGPLLSPAARHAYQTLPAVFVEPLLGGHGSYQLRPGTLFGVTGYATSRRSLVQGIELGTEPRAQRPPGSWSSALGAHAEVRRGALELAAELARSRDPLGRGVAAVARLRLSRGDGALEVTLRYYPASFANRHARPSAAPDALDGLRARDEAGARTRVAWGDALRAVRGSLDAWVNPSSGIPKVSAYLGGHWQARRALRLAGSVSFDDKDLTRGGAEQCFEASSVVDELGASVPCGGRKLVEALTLGAALSPVEVSFGLRHEVVDAGRPGAPGRRHGISLELSSRYGAGGVSARAHVRYRRRALSDAAFEAVAGATLRVLLRDADALQVSAEGALTGGDPTGSMNAPVGDLRALLSRAALRVGYEVGF